MCFSASASFIASGVLSTIGLLSIASIKDRKWLAIALIPVFFAIQQFAEGFVWLYQWPTAALVFLFFAFIVWPFYIPFSCLMVESDNARRRLLYALMIIGSGLSLCLLFGLLSSDMSFYAQDCHIVYDVAQLLLAKGWVRMLLGFVYVLVTIVPFFISSVPHMRKIGFLIAISCLVAYFFYTIYFISVWCFFSALISSTVLLIVRKKI